MVLLLFLTMLFIHLDIHRLLFCKPECYQLGVRLPKSQHFPGRSFESIPSWSAQRYIFILWIYCIDGLIVKCNIPTKKWGRQCIDIFLVNSGSFLAGRWNRVTINVPTKGYFAFCFSQWRQKWVERNQKKIKFWRLICSVRENQVLLEHSISPAGGMFFSK